MFNLKISGVNLRGTQQRTHPQIQYYLMWKRRKEQASCYRLPGILKAIGCRRLRLHLSHGTSKPEVCWLPRSAHPAARSHYAVPWWCRQLNVLSPFVMVKGVLLGSGWPQWWVSPFATDFPTGLNRWRCGYQTGSIPVPPASAKRCWTNWNKIKLRHYLNNCILLMKPQFAAPVNK